jgi:hypothetical protein
MHSALAAVFEVDPGSGARCLIDLGLALASGDGILLVGPRLWVARNLPGQVSEVALRPGPASSTVVQVRSSPALRIATTWHARATGRSSPTRDSTSASRGRPTPKTRSCSANAERRLRGPADRCLRRRSRRRRAGRQRAVTPTP